MMELYLHYPIHLRGVVLNELSTRKILSSFLSPRKHTVTSLQKQKINAWEIDHR
jgi:hypothetical protein